MDNLISVVVPIYNVENYLERCVESLINQTYKNIEIILVDDGSPDNCPEICNNYANKDNRIKVIHKANGGLSDARNAGTEVATGRYICYIDSDDWIDKTMFQDMIDRILTDDSDIVSCGVKWVDEEGNLIRNVTSESDTIIDKEQAMKEIINDGLLKQHVWNKLYKTELIKDIPFEKGKYHEDVFWSYQVFGVAKSVSIMKDSYYYYVQRSNSIMGEAYSEKRIDALDAMKQRCVYIEKYFPDLYDSALNIYLGSCMYHLQLALNTKCSSEIIDNIKSRLSFKKTGNIFNCLSGKQKLWMRLFLIFPGFTCKVRNLLKIGM